ncbi:DUF4079 domain-containing protein [Aphanothece sacrum]|uniref:DUF4079 domain-containing protein n=1 Tax=Aphanothece sacrum FPU1 TaxID=1920663 RepID=A0A401ICL0_APHSA|nr:DUF4079 domain-containing protein [Aphanothece sacrum]GBF78982.1 hypothetical protein AsFPU1_0374 [Aphanothece sacrum FPU1]GBF86670.1 hypothetical protein AsFPU3_3742 [Aphanothece sacrum FPU3]
MNLVIPETVKFWSQFGHPILMWVLLGLTVYALYSGIQWRRTRTADKDTRKELIQKDFRTKHYQIGSLLLALMVLGTIGGMAVTYINNGKLFFGPHLLVGLSMTGLIAISAALIPLMQKGNEFARYTHITLNVTLLGLFTWQAVTGMEIVQKILSKL